MQKPGAFFEKFVLNMVNLIQHQVGMLLSIFALVFDAVCLSLVIDR
jgi:hypothetical protein